MLRLILGEGDAWKLLERSARQVWGLEGLPRVARRPDGKPVFADRPDLHFNLSHSGALVLCALSDRPVGVDIEIVRPRSAGLPAYVFRGTEYERFRALGGDWGAFYTLWTEKESILKYTGAGLKDLRRAQTPPGCVLTHLSGESWRGAVCGSEAPRWLAEP